MKQFLFKTVCLICLLLLFKPSFAQIGKCKGKYLGNIIAGGVPSNYTTYWNQVTSENASKWGSVEGTMGQYNFGGSDVCYNWAKNNNGIFKYHNLIWGGQTPGWVNTAATATITNNIDPYFKAVRDHYAPMGGLKMIDVLNEPVNTPMPGNLKAALTAGYQAEPANANDKNNQYGWAIWCFQMARKYFPDATLLINEYNIEMNWNNCRAPYIAMVQAIKNAPNLTDGKKNLIDGVGLQCHGIDNLSATNFKACLDEIWSKTGVAIHITEFDQTANPNEAKQQSVYSTLIPVAWEHPHVAGITLWGYIQGSTWIGGNGTLGPNGTDSGILYSGNYSSKPYGERPAMTWLKQYFASQASLSCCPAPAPFASCTATNNPPTVSITSPSSNATFTAPASITINASAADADGTISIVQFYNGTTLLGSDATSPYSFVWANVAAGTYTLTAKATDNANATATSTMVTVTVSNPIVQTPYNGTAFPIPGKIEAEQYDLGGQGVAYNETTTGNSGNVFRTDNVDIEATTDAGGGYDVGYVAAGEWLEYTVNVATTGAYNLEARLASTSTGGTLHIEMDGVNISGAITVPNTGAWQTFQSVTINNLNLTAGQKVMRIAFDAADMNVNYVAFTKVVVNTAPIVSITSPANNAIFTAPASITINANASDADGTVSNVQFYNGTTLLGSDATSPYSFTWSSVGAGTYSLTAKATDNTGAVTTSSAVSVTVSNPIVQSPFSGTPSLIPGKIEAENYDLGGAGVAFNETTAGNSGNVYRTDDVDVEATTDMGGGYNVGWIEAGEWLEYTVNVTAAGAYNLEARVASANPGGTFHVEMDGVNISGAITVANTTAWQTFQSVSINNINLTAGQKVMRIVMDASWFNLNYVAFTAVNVPPTVSISSPASNAVFTAPASIAISANASDADGTIGNVQFYQGTTLLGSDATSPYSFTWNNVAAGTYTLTARATDNAGAVTTSAAVTVIVNACTPSAITPYVLINGGAWTQGSTAILDAGGSVTFGPQPVSGGSWSWSGPNGFTANTREILLSSIQTNQAGNYVTTYTNASGCNSTYTFSVTVTVPTTIIQCETACSVDGTLNETFNAGFNGTGYVNTDNFLGASATWLVNSPTTQTISLGIRYAHITAAGRPMSLSVNGVVQISNIAFGPTASNTTWVVSTVQITLTAGVNTIKFVSTSAQGSPYMDELVYGGTVTAGSCPAAKMSAIDATTVQSSIAPNPSADVFNLTVQESVQSFSIVNDMGIVVSTGSSIEEGESVSLGEALPSGLYIVRIQYVNGKTETKKIQKSR